MILLVLGCFYLFVHSIHNVSPQEEVANLWQICGTKEPKANVGIWSSTRYAT
jgi:hypothetical protein